MVYAQGYFLAHPSELPKREYPQLNTNFTTPTNYSEKNAA
jgi:hypothetical protein